MRIIAVSLLAIVACSGTAPRATPLVLTLSNSNLERPELVKLEVIAPTEATRMEFYRNDTAVGTDTEAPFILELPFDQNETTAYQLKAIAFDKNQQQIAENSTWLAVNIKNKVWYVSPTGADTNDGSSKEKPFATMQKAMDTTNPGDTVLVMNGTYSNTTPNSSIVSIERAGTANAWITLMAYPGHKPKLQAKNWSAISVNTSYIIVEGFTIEGNRDEITLEYAKAEQNNSSNPITGGNGIAITSVFTEPNHRAHHVVIRKNTVSKCPGGGIYTYSADYVTIEDNIIWGNAYYSPYANSGLSFYQNWNSDQSTTTKMIARRNIIYDNKNLIPFLFSDTDPAKRSITDGNGIIVDDSRNTQNNSALGAYKGRTLLENNIVYNNGARGLHVYESDHVEIINNTTYQNSMQPETPEGEITTISASDVNVFNNIMYARADRPSITRYAKDATELATQVFEHNLVFGGTKFDADSSKNLVGINPKFVDTNNKNFKPQNDSPAIDAGNTARAAKEDFTRAKRPKGNGIDIGAFEMR